MVTPDQMINKIAGYLKTPALLNLNIIKNRTFKIAELALGEYNLNYRLIVMDNDVSLVFRINIGT